MSKTTIYLREKWKDSLLTGQAYSVPSLYVGIFSVLPTELGTNGTEPAVSGTTGYARALATNKWQSGSGAGLPFENDEILNFECLQTSWSGSGTSSYPVLGIGLWDAASAGNCLAFAAINPTRIININQDLDIGFGALTIALA